VPICSELPSSWWSPEIGLHLLLHAHIKVRRHTGKDRVKMLTGRSLAAGDHRRSHFRGSRDDLAGDNELQLDGEPIGGGAARQ
jgi:hypothetical protein